MDRIIDAGLNKSLYEVLPLEPHEAIPRRPTKRPTSKTHDYYFIHKPLTFCLANMYRLPTLTQDPINIEPMHDSSPNMCYQCLLARVYSVLRSVSFAETLGKSLEHPRSLWSISPDISALMFPRC